MLESVFETFVLLFLVTDPFGNLPFILLVLRDLDARRYRHAILRETLAAFVALYLFLFFGDWIIAALGLSPPTLTIAGGMVLFLISLRMIFGSVGELFDHEYGADPVLVPIAMPSIAGPSAITAVMIIKGRGSVEVLAAAIALLLLLVVSLGLYACGRRLAGWMGPKGLHALEKLMGMILNLIAVDLILDGLSVFLRLEEAAVHTGFARYR